MGITWGWIGLLTLFALLLGIELTAGLAWGLSHWTPVSVLSAHVLPEWRHLLMPEWETVEYRFFVFVCILAMGGLIWWIRRTAFPTSQMISFLVVEGVLVFGLLSALFKQAVYPDRAILAHVCTAVFLILCLLNKIFWPFVHRAIEKWSAILLNDETVQLLSRIGVWLMPVALILIIDVPNVEGVVARFFIGEQFHHNDSFLLGPGWAYVSGARLDVDVISQYGVGLGALIGSIGKWLGSFSYENAFRTRLYGSIVYYIMCFWFLRAWLKSTAVAAIGILFLIKVQMFHTGVFPFVFTYSSATVMRYWFDIWFFWAILAHLRRPSPWWLFAAAAACGAELFYILSEGVYLTTAYIFYLALHLCHREWRDQAGLGFERWPLWLALLAMPGIVAVVLLHLFIGPSIYTPLFWANVREFVAYFLNGFGVTPITSSLGDRQFLASLMGFIMPLVYVFTLLGVGALLLLRKIERRHMIVCVLCVYGLAIYHYYVARSAVTSYYVTAMPYAMILSFWLRLWCDHLSPEAARKWKWTLLAVCVWALGTTHNFTAYPNRLNFSRNPLTDPLVAQPLPDGQPYFNHLFRGINPELKVPLNSLGQTDEGLVSESNFATDDDLLAYYRKEGDFSEDASLIDRLTSPNQPVPLISSFEIKILMQANRRPYFYYFPLAISRPMQARGFPRSSIYTTDQLQKVLTALATDKPPYIFMEKILLTRPLPDVFYYYYSGMMYLTDDVLKHYTPVEQGKYLVALKRKP